MRLSPVGPRLLVPDNSPTEFEPKSCTFPIVSAFLATPGDQIDCAPGPLLPEHTT